MARTNGPIQVWSRTDTTPTDVEGGYAGGDSTAAAVGTSLDQSSKALGTVENLAVTASTLDYGQEATATISGASPWKTIHVGIPKGMPDSVGQQLVTDAQTSADAAAQSAADADAAVLLAQQAQAAAYNVPDTAMRDIINNPATETSVALAAREAWVDPADYGAVGDGTTDDYTALTDALVEAGNTGRKVRLRPVTYATTQPLAVNSPIDGEPGATVRLTASSARMVNLTSPDAVVTGVTFHADGNATSEVVRFTAGATLRGCTVTDTGHAAVYGLATFAKVDGVTIEDCTLTGLRTAVRLISGSSDATIRNNRITQWQQRGIWILDGNSTNVTIEGNRVTDISPGGSSRYPIRVEGDTSEHSNFTVRGNYVQGAGTAYNDAVTPGTADQISLTRIAGLLVEGNTSVDGGDAGMTISQQCSDVRVVGNRVMRSDSPGLYVGSAETTFISGVTITGNTFHDCGQDRLGDGGLQPRGKTGVRVINAQYVSIEGNVFGNSAGTSPQLYGASVWNSTGVTVGANRSANLGSAMIYDESGAGVVEVRAQPPEASVTLDGLTGYPSSTVTAIRRAGFVTLSVRFTVGTATSGDWLAQLPAGFRPTVNMNCNAGSSNGETLAFNVTQSGAMPVLFSTTPSAGYFQACVTFPHA